MQAREDEEVNSKVDSSTRSQPLDDFHGYFLNDWSDDFAFDPFKPLGKYRQRRDDDFDLLDDEDLAYFGGNKKPQEDSRTGMFAASSASNGAELKKTGDDDQSETKQEEEKDVDLAPSTVEEQDVTVPVGVVTQVVVEIKEEHRPLNVGSILRITETKAPLGRVEAIYEDAMKRTYVVRLDSASQLPHGTHVSAVKCFDSSFEIEKKRRMSSEEVTSDSRMKKQNTNMALGEDVSLPDSQMAQLESQNLRRSSQPSHWAQQSTLFNQPCPTPPSLIKHYVQRKLMRSETNQQNKIQTNPVSNPQQNLGKSGQVTEPNRGAQGPTLFDQPLPNAEAPMMHNLEQNFMRTDTNQLNQIQAPKALVPYPQQQHLPDSPDPCFGGRYYPFSLPAPQQMSSQTQQGQSQRGRRGRGHQDRKKPKQS